MPSLLDTMISAGAIPAVASTNGESVLILGPYSPDAGKRFFCNSIEFDHEIALQTDLSDDPRAGWVVRFDPAQPIPSVDRGDQLQQDTGQVWEIVRLLSIAAPQPGCGKTLDYLIKEIVASKDS